MTFYRRNLPHYQRDYRYHFITFATYKRCQFPDWARDITLASCLHDNLRTFDLVVAVVMPDHVHLILTPLILISGESLNVYRITGDIKSASAHAINKRLNRNGHVWQDESWDHVVRHGDLSAKMEYVIQNPVIKGLAGRPEDYRWLWVKQPIGPSR